MNFLLSSEQIEFQDIVLRLLDEHCPSTHLHKLFDQEGAYDDALWRRLSELGVAGIALPEAFGGAAMEMIDVAVVAEAFGARAAPVPFFGHTLVGLAIAWAGSPEQQARWLPGLAGGSVLGTIAWAEGGGWAPEAWTLSEDKGRVAGTKCHVPFGSQADLLLVGLADGGLGIVERAAEGVAIEPEPAVDRTRPLSSVTFDEAPIERLDGAADAAQRLRDAACVLLAADAFGGASRCVAMAVGYAKVREQFGQVIGLFQAVKHQLVNMAVEVEPARGLYWYAAHAFDHVPQHAHRYAMLAKTHLADRFLQVARDTVEAHGGIGYTWECDVQIYLKRAMHDYALLGNSPQLRSGLDFAMGAGSAQ